MYHTPTNKGDPHLHEQKQMNPTKCFSHPNLLLKKK